MSFQMIVSKVSDAIFSFVRLTALVVAHDPSRADADFSCSNRKIGVAAGNKILLRRIFKSG